MRALAAALSAAALALSCLSRGAAAALLSISLSLPAQAPLRAGASVRVAFVGALTPGDAANATAARLVPYFDGAQYGAEVGFSSYDAASSTASGEAFVPLSWAAAPAASLQLAFQGPPNDGPTLGRAPPAGALLSNAVALSVAPRVPARGVPALGPGDPMLTVYFETWFTPLNFYWQSYSGGPAGAGVAEAIPSVGRYASVSLDAMRTQAAQFVQAGVDALVVDWTNNCWQPGCDSWDHRSLGIRELINATDLLFGVYAGLRRSEGWPVPRFVLLLGLDNGPTTPLPALEAELDYIATAYLGNETAGGAESFVVLEGKPLVIIFDGSGADHSDYTHANFTIRWMASQLQSTPDFARRGIWSWMDASLKPVVTLDPHNASALEAATLAPAFFGAGGWLNSALAVGRSGGLTLLAELSALMTATAATGLPRFVNVCQWNEYAGTPEGGPGTSYEDSYSPDLSNDLEPTSPWAPAYVRPGGVRAGGGYGYTGVNALALARALVADPTAADGSAAIFIIAPAAGTLANYTAPRSVKVSFVAARFDSAGLRDGSGLLSNVTLATAIAVDGAVVAQLPAPAAPGVQDYTLDVSALDARFPHVITVSAADAAGLTCWPLAFDSADADGPDAVPLAAPVPARATAWLWLPESQAA